MNQKMNQRFQENQRKMQSKPSKATLLQKVKETKSLRSGTVQTPVEESLQETIEHYKNLYKNMKAECEKLKKEQKNKPAQHSKQNKKEEILQQEIENKKQEVFLLRQDLTDEQKRRKETEQLLSQWKKKYQELETDNNDLQITHKKTSEHLKIITSKIDSYRSRNENFEQKRRKLSKSLKEMNERVQALENSKKRALLKNSDMQHYINSILQLRPEVIISYLYDELSLNNYGNYSDIPLLNRQVLTMSYAQKMKRASVKKKEGKKASEITPIPMFGYISLAEPESAHKWRFVSIDNESYEIINKTSYPVQEGMPIAAVVNEENGTAMLTWVYGNVGEMKRDKERESLREKRRQDVVKEEKTTYLQMEPVSVLLLTAHQGVKYRDRLQKHGVEVEWMDPFEKNMSHIRAKASSYDYVYLFIDHTPKALKQQLMDEFADNQDKIQIFYSGNIQTVLTRTRYLALAKSMENTPTFKRLEITMKQKLTMFQ